MLAPIQCEDASIYQHMRVQDVAAFALAAKMYKVFIVVRRTNEASIQYVGKPGFMPKPIDCKAKTADLDVTIKGKRYEIAGLVVNPHLVGPDAYRPGKHQSAVEEWEKFKSHLAPPKGAYVSPEQPYGVQEDPAKPRYGAVVGYRFGQRSENTQIFIHGDYDLFSIVPVDDPGSNVFVQEFLLGQPHSRGKQLMDVQNFVNSRMGVPMVLHGEQDHFKDTFDDTVDIFFPDGFTVKTRQGAMLQQFFAQEFRGRKPHKTGAPTQSAGGLWKRG